MDSFTVFPAIDLRRGRVVRLAQGDPSRETMYAEDAGKVAADWAAAGASWIHVVNLDGALGESSLASQEALAAILQARLRIQFGGGIRTLRDMEETLVNAVGRIILGTAALEAPDLVEEAIARFGPERVGAAIDVRRGRVRVRGWTRDSALAPQELAERLCASGVRIAVYTDIARDGVGRGLNVETAHQLAETTGLEIIVSGGLSSLDDIRMARRAGLRGVIVGRALYEGLIPLSEALRC